MELRWIPDRSSIRRRWLLFANAIADASEIPLQLCHCLRWVHFMTYTMYDRSSVRNWVQLLATKVSPASVNKIHSETANLVRLLTWILSVLISQKKNYVNVVETASITVSLIAGHLMNWVRSLSIEWTHTCPKSIRLSVVNWVMIEVAVWAVRRVHWLRANNSREASGCSVVAVTSLHLSRYNLLKFVHLEVSSCIPASVILYCSIRSSLKR